MRSIIVGLVLGATVAQAQATAAKTLQPIWSANGGDGDSSFAEIWAIAVAPNGNVGAWDGKTPALRLFSDAGKPLKAIGRKGAGPGEWGNSVSGMAFGADNRLYLWDSGNGWLNIYKPNGDFEQQMRLPINGFSTNNG